MEELPRKESLTVEFKSDASRLADDVLVEEVVAMANTHGGDIYLGVEDDGTPTGLHSARQDAFRIAVLVGNKTRPSVPVRVETLDIGGVRVARILVPPFTASLIATAGGKILRRRIRHDGAPETVPVYPFEIPRLLANVGSFDVSDQPVPGAVLSDFDPLERERLRQTIRKYNGDLSLLELSDDELDGALGLARAVDGERVPTIAGLLLIGREDSLRRLLPTHEVMFQVLAGTEVRVNDSYRGPLLRTFETILERFRARNEEKEIDIGLFRVPVPDYDERVFREALVNALSHRDYTLLGAVHVQMTSDGLVISNPGGLIEGVTVENLLDVPPRSRNPRLTDALKRVGSAERAGRGVDHIYQGMLRYGRPEPDYSATTSTSVTVNLAGTRADTAFLVMILGAEQRQGGPLRVTELLILARLREERRIGTAELADVLHRSESATRAMLERLVEAGLVEAHGAGRGRSFTLSAQVYYGTGQPSEFVRQTGFDPIQQEQMVLKYVEKHGAIRRREVADVCRISDDQAFRLLKRLVDRGELARQGIQKGTTYVRRA